MFKDCASCKLMYLVAHETAVGDAISAMRPYSAMPIPSRGQLELRYPLPPPSLGCDRANLGGGIARYPAIPEKHRCDSRESLNRGLANGGLRYLFAIDHDFLQFRNGQSTVGGPKWTKMEHFGLPNAKIQFGIILTKMVIWTILDHFGPVHFPTVPCPFPSNCRHFAMKSPFAKGHECAQLQTSVRKLQRVALSTLLRACIWIFPR